MSDATDIEYKTLIKAINRKYPIKIPYHKDVVDYLKIIFTPEQAIFLGSVFKQPFLDMLTLKQIVTRAKKAGIDINQEQAKKLLAPLTKKGVLMHIFGMYALLPFVPGLFEFYFSAHSDSLENLKKVAKQMEKLRDGPVKLLNEISATKTPVFRILPHSEAVEKTIEINKSLNVQTEILPFEVVKEFLNQVNDYCVVDCSCRYHSQILDDSCEKCPDGDIRICMALGPASAYMVEGGWGTRLTREEALEKIKATEKAGLVHSVMNSREAPVLICNCCACHCGILSAVKDSRSPRSVVKSNFLPQIDQQKCILCEKCVKLCPMDALFHYFPRNENLDDEHVQLNEQMCIGCGVCATNCAKEAITLKKVKNEIPVKDFVQLFKKSEADRIF
ncbi:MAG: 4Fe-4S dicluster domain-containing protein [Candidatus Helarchaeota archaeon]|nr:4Fe-4S dicluster domain-containing protein [Candidatus Helarchaeota archaeon]